MLIYSARDKKVTYGNKTIEGFYCGEVLNDISSNILGVRFGLIDIQDAYVNIVNYFNSQQIDNVQSQFKAQLDKLCEEGNIQLETGTNYKELFFAAIEYIEKSPYDTNITSEQAEAWLKLQTLLAKRKDEKS